jgi:hypothetical protein
MNRPRLITIAVISIPVLFVSQVGAEVFLPGMQPKEAGIEFAKVQQCRMCHANTKNGPVRARCYCRGRFELIEPLNVVPRSRLNDFMPYEYQRLLSVA